MKKIFCSVMLLFAVTTMFAQTTGSKVNDTQSTAILDALQKKITSYSSAIIQFKLREEKNDKVLSELSGTLYLKGNKYMLNTKDQQIFCNAKDVWTYLPAQNEVSITTFDSTDSDNLNPLQLVKEYKKSYRSTFIREEVQRGVMVQIVDLTPLKASSIGRVRLIIDKNKKQLLKTEILEKDGTTYNYIIEKLTVNQTIDDSKFIFKTSQYPNVDVIDMR